MTDWEREHPKITARLTPAERNEVQAALEARGLTAREGLLAWAQHAELKVDIERLADERERLSAEVDRLRGEAATLEVDLAARRAEAEAKLRAALKTLRREADNAKAEVARLSGEVDHLTAARDTSLQALPEAGVAPDDPALGVYLAAVMLRPLVETAGRDAVAEAFAYLRAAAAAVRSDAPPDPAAVAASLLRRVDRAEATARAQVAGAVWGQRIAAQLGQLPSADAQTTWRAFEATGRLPESWLHVAADAVRRTGFHLAPEAIPEFVRAATYGIGHLGPQAVTVSAAPPVRASHKDAQADALARLRALIGLSETR